MHCGRVVTRHGLSVGRGRHCDCRQTRDQRHDGDEAAPEFRHRVIPLPEFWLKFVQPPVKRTWGSAGYSRRSQQEKFF